LALQEAGKRKHLLERDLARNKSKMEQNNLVVAQMQQELELTKQLHAEQVNNLTERYSEFASQVKHYHHTLRAAMEAEARAAPALPPTHNSPPSPLSAHQTSPRAHTHSHSDSMRDHGSSMVTAGITEEFTSQGDFTQDLIQQ
jgi:hypothetical protein